MSPKEVGFDPLQYLTRKQTSTRELFTGSKNAQNSEDPLIAAATKRNADTIKATNFMLKQRLVEEMDKTVQNYVKEHKELKNNYYLAFITDENYAAEVLPLNAVANAVKDLPQDKALQFLSANPVGYFKRSDFTLKTENTPVYQGFKQTIDTFMKDHASIVKYLQKNAGNIIKPEDFVR